MAINRAEQNWPENTVEVIADFIRETNEPSMPAAWDWVAEAGLAEYRVPEVTFMPVRMLPAAKRNELARAAVLLAVGLGTLLIAAAGLYFAVAR